MKEVSQPGTIVMSVKMIINYYDNSILVMTCSKSDSCCTSRGSTRYMVGRDVRQFVNRGGAGNETSLAVYLVFIPHSTLL